VNSSLALVQTSENHLAPHLLAAAAFLSRYNNPGTREGYAADLRIYFAWCEGNIPGGPMAARRVHVQLFVRYLEVDRGYTPAGIQRLMVAVRGLYRMAVIDDVLDRNPCEGVVTPRVVHDPTRKPFLTRHEVADLLAAASTNPTDLALVHLLVTIGMRVTEACNIDVTDLCRRDGWPAVRIVQKRKKPAMRALPLPVWEAVEKARGGRKAGPLLLQSLGDRMTRRAAGYRLDAIAKRAGITKHVHPHMLRRTHITIALREGIDLRTVQLSVGHASSSTTLIYDALGIELHNQTSHRISAIFASST
jgi:site-specific recombinase XerD